MYENYKDQTNINITHHTFTQCSKFTYLESIITNIRIAYNIYNIFTTTYDKVGENVNSWFAMRKAATKAQINETNVESILQIWRIDMVSYSITNRFR